jgi:hypothetical protein
MTAFDTCAISARAAEVTWYSPSAAKSPTVFLSIAEVDFAPEGDFILEAVGVIPPIATEKIREQLGNICIPQHFLSTL